MKSGNITLGVNIHRRNRCFEDRNGRRAPSRGEKKRDQINELYLWQSEILITLGGKNFPKFRIPRAVFDDRRQTFWESRLTPRKTSISGTRTFRGLLNALMTSIHSVRLDTLDFRQSAPAISGIHRTCLLGNRVKLSGGQTADFRT